MAAISQSVHGSAIGSPKSQRTAREGPSTTPPTQESLPVPTLHVADEKALNVDSVAIATQQPHVAESPHTSSSGRFSKFSQLARRVMGKYNVNDLQSRAEEGRQLASARGVSPLAVSPAGSSSQTVHDTDAYEGTTAVDHDNYEALPVAQAFSSPIYVEPKLTNDYAKMESPRASIVSINSYIHRVRQFLHELNDLPWVAERVTVDYVPGADRDRRRPRVIHRPLSWYGNTPHSRRPSLFSDSTSPASQPSQVQLPPLATLQPPALDRSISAKQESSRMFPPQPEVLWEIINPANPSDAPYATVVPANWSLHPATPSNHLEPTVLTQQPKSELRSPLEPHPTANPQPTIPQQAASTWSYPGRPTDGSQRFVPIGETFPTGYVPYAHAQSIETAYQDRRIHPQPQEFTTQDPVPQHGVPASAGTIAAQTAQGGFEVDTPQTARDLDEPLNASVAEGASLSASGAPTPYYPNAQNPVVAPTPRKASWSTAPTQAAVLANVEATPRATVASPGSLGNPPSVAPSRTSQRSHGRAPSVRTVQSADRPKSDASSHASRVPSARNQIQARSRPPSLAPSHVSRPPSVAASAMTQTPNRPPSVALSHASRAPSARASQSRPVSVARSYVSHAPSATSRTPGSMQFLQPVLPPAA